MYCRGFGVLVLGVVCLISLVEAISTDTVLTKELEDVIKNEDFVVTLRHIRPRRRHRTTSETLFTVDFIDSDDKFSVLLDRTERNVIIDTVEEGRKRKQHFTVDTLESNAIIPSLILAFDQKQPGAKVFLYVDCISYGMIATPKTPKEMYTEMDVPMMQVLREKKYHMEIDQDNIRKILLINNCSMDTVNMHTKRNLDALFSTNPASSNELADEPTRQLTLTRSGRGDIEIQPIPDGDDCSDITSTINKLIVAVNQLSSKTERNTEVVARLDERLRQCDICRTIVTTCETNPPNCFEGVSCINTQQGPKCGQCPEGYEGNGYQCYKKRETCEEKHCHPLAGCDDSSGVARCGRCPRGYIGNGEHCERCPPGHSSDGTHCFVINCDEHQCRIGQRCVPTAHGPECQDCPAGYYGNGKECIPEGPCRHNPCFEGVECTETAQGPRCGSCPKGFEGNGYDCRPLRCSQYNPCPSSAECQDTSKGPTCRCHPHMIRDGHNCRYPTCDEQPCRAGFRCDDTSTGPTCVRCPPDTRGDGRTCRTICSYNPCGTGEFTNCCPHGQQK